MKVHICQNCKKEYPCPEPIDHFTGKPCDLPKRFGHCSKKCKWENFGLRKTTVRENGIISLEYGDLKH